MQGHLSLSPCFLLCVSSPAQQNLQQTLRSAIVRCGTADCSVFRTGALVGYVYAGGDPAAFSITTNRAAYKGSSPDVALTQHAKDSGLLQHLLGAIELDSANPFSLCAPRTIYQLPSMHSFGRASRRIMMEQRSIILKRSSLALTSFFTL